MEGLLQIGEQDFGSEGGEALMDGVSVFVTLQLPDHLYQHLAALAKAQQVPVSQVASKIVKDYIERVDDGVLA